MFSAWSKSPRHPACEVSSMMYACLLKALSSLCHETSTLAIEIHPPMKTVQSMEIHSTLKPLNYQLKMLAVLTNLSCPENSGLVDKK